MYSTSGNSAVPSGRGPANLVVGIDFGTTFTGVAYCHTGAISLESCGVMLSDMKRFSNRLVVVRQWPTQDADKIPSVVAYNTIPPLWGDSVGRKDKPYNRYFKLGLQENIGMFYPHMASSANGSLIGGYLDNPNWRHPALPSKTALDYTSDYLTRVLNWVSTETLPRTFGAEFLRNQRVSYIITVPAIWSDKAKELTRQAAVRARINRRDLMLISEPEAAALHCATWCTDVHLKEGDNFMICDAGGGTVVCPSASNFASD